MRSTVVILFVLLARPVFAQLGHHTFGGDGHDYFQQILPIDDSTFYLLGTKTNVWGEVWLMKINSNCEILWEKTYGDTSAHLYAHRINWLADGNLMIVGERRSGPRPNERIAIAMKMNPEGEQIWQRKYTGISALVDVLQQGSALMFLGRYDDAGSSGILLRTSVEGLESIRKSVKVNYETWPKRLLPSYNGSMYIVGRANDLGGFEFSGVFLQRVDKNGVLIWTRTLHTDFQERDPDDNAFFIESMAALRDADGSVWISNAIGSKPDVVLVHYDVNGNKLEESKYGNPGYAEYPYAMVRVDGGFNIAGRTEDSGFSLLVKENGPQLRHEYCQSGDSITRYLDALSTNEGFLLFGMTYAHDSLSPSYDGLITKARKDGSILPWKVTGKAMFDKGSSCTLTNENQPASGWFVSVQRTSMIHPPDTQIYQTNADGEFYFYTNDGSSTINLLNPDPLLWSICNSNQLIISDYTNPEDSVILFIQEADPCGRVAVSITQPDLMRCDTSCALITLQNNGLDISVPYTLNLTLDTDLDLVSCSEPFMRAGRHIEIEILPIDERSVKRIELCMRLDCGVQLGATHLINASIAPLQCSAQYDGPKYVLSGRCMGESVLFTVGNVGGRATSYARYNVFADHLLISDNASIDLKKSGSTQTIRFPADGRTWRIELEQAPGYQGTKVIHTDVEGCGRGTNDLYSIGYRNMHGSFINDPSVSEVYIPNTTGVPNKISACTHGLGNYNLIYNLEPLEFSVRTLNSFDQPVHTVKYVLDFSARFDVPTFYVTASNGPVSLEYRAGQIIATMNDLMISPGRSAMMRFRISPVAHIPPDEGEKSLLVIEGSAYLNNGDPIALEAGFVNYTKQLPIETDEYYNYPMEILRFGGRNYDFATSISEGPDQSLFLVGESNSYSDRTSFDALVIKTNSMGQVAWLNAFDLNGSSTSFYGVAPLEDGGCIAAGNYIDAGLEYYARNTHMYIVRLDKFGELKWELKMRPVSDTLGAWTNGMIETVDHNFLVYGYAQNAGGMDQFYCKLNEDGEILWIKHTEVIGSSFRPDEAKMLPDGSIVFLGVNESTILNYDTFLEKIGPDGNVIWSKGYESENNIYLEGLAVTEDGGIMVTGMSQWAPAPNDYVISPTFIKFNENGDLLWEKSILIGPYQYAWPHDIVEGPDNTFLVTGEVYIDTADHHWDVLLMMIDQNADTVWTRSYGAKTIEWAERVIVMSNGRFALWGFNQPRPPLYDIQGVFIITDPDGNIVSNTDSKPANNTHLSIVFPNPANENVQVLLSPFPTSIVQWQIMSIDGRLLIDGQGLHDVISIDTRALSNGTYFIQFPDTHYPPIMFVIVH